MMNSKFDYLNKKFQEKKKKNSNLYPKSLLKNWSKNLIKKKCRGANHHLAQPVKSLIVKKEIRD